MRRHHATLRLAFALLLAAGLNLASCSSDDDANRHDRPQDVALDIVREAFGDGTPDTRDAYSQLVSAMMRQTAQEKVASFGPVKRFSAMDHVIYLNDSNAYAQVAVTYQNDSTEHIPVLLTARNGCWILP